LPPQDSTQQSNPPSGNAPAGQKPEEKKKQEAPPAETQTQPGQLKLETPQAEEAKKPEQQPAAQAPGQIKLETPKPEQAEPQKPQAEKPAGTPNSPEARKDLIEAIIFRGNRRIPANTLRARMFTHVGDAYDESSLERDFMALWNTGYLDDIRLEATDGEKGKILTFYVREKKLVRSIDYKGLSTVQQSDVLDRYKERKVPLSIQSQYDPVVVKRAEVALQDLLAEHGRQFASVRARTRNIPPQLCGVDLHCGGGPQSQSGPNSVSG